jgi:anti-sigma B factor antagonist
MALTMENSPYLVFKEANPVILQVQGRASFDNCAPVREFFANRRQAGQTQFVVDLKNCRGMDSTFLGILAGLANELSTLGGEVTLTRPSPTLISIIQNLGLNRLLKVVKEFNEKSGGIPLPPQTLNELEQAKLVLQAHESLVAANPATKPNFLDVIEFLKERLNS